MAVISGEDYYTIATEFAAGYEQQVAVIDRFYNALQALKCLDDIDVTVELLGPFHTAYQIATGRLADTTTYEAAVLTIQQHITSDSGQSAAVWIQQNIMDTAVNTAGIPNAWAILSKKVGYNIDSKIDPATETSSSSNSSSS